VHRACQYIFSSHMVSGFASDYWNSIKWKGADRHFEALLGRISTWCMVNSPCRSKEHNVILSTRSHSRNYRCTDIYLRRDKKGQSIKVETMVEAPAPIYSFMSHWPGQKLGTWRISHVAVEGFTEAHPHERSGVANIEPGQLSSKVESYVPPCRDGRPISVW